MDKFAKKKNSKTRRTNQIKVEARLYKMVLYEEGGFFKAHKDTEKEPGMFATLVVQLPAKHDEGKLVVRHRGKEEDFDFSQVIY